MSSQPGLREIGPFQDPPATRPSSHQRGIDFWSMIVRRKWMMLLLLAGGTGAGYVQYLGATPQFQSRAQIQVQKRRTTDLPLRSLDSDPESRRPLETQMILIKSPRILDRAVEELNLSSLESLAGKGDPATVIASGLSIDQEAPDILQVRYVGPNSADCRTVLDAVIKSYKQFLDEDYNQRTNELVDWIRQAKDELLDKLTQLETEFQEFQVEHPYIFRINDETQNVYRSRMVAIEEARSQLFLRKTMLDAEVRSIEKALADGGTHEATRLMVMNLAEHTTTEEGKPQSVAAQLFPLLLEEQIQLETHGPDHPDVKMLRKRIQMTRQFLQDSTAGVTDVDPASGNRDFVEIYLDSLKQQIKVAELKEHELSTRLDSENQNYKDTQKVESQYQSYRERIADHKKLFDTIVQRLSEVDLVKDMGGYRMEETAPAKFGVQIAPALPKFLIVGALLGALAGTLFSLVREINDKRFIAPADVHLQIGAPVIGHIADIPESRQILSRQSLTVDPTICTFHQPKSQFAESYRAVRTALYFNSRRNGQKVIQITSPKPGDGKSTLAANLAVSIANSGKQVLLVDADFRRPRIHKLFGLENKTGLACTIAKGDDVDPLEAIQPTDTPNLFCLTSGKQPDNPGELLTSSAFDRFLDVVRAKYDYVIIDTPPMLVVTDPSTVAARADGVILIIRLSKHSRATASQAAAMLSAVGAKVIGVVVNGFGQSSYGRQMGYAAGYRADQYGYGYDYAAKEAAAYYANGSQEHPDAADSPIVAKDANQA